MAVLTSCSKVLLTHDLDNPKPLLNISPHKGAINTSVWNHNNQVIATCGSDGKVVLNHSQKGQNLLSLEDDNNKTNPINSISFTSNSQFLASGGNDGILKIWDLKKRAMGSQHRCHFSSINSVHWNLDDTIVGSSSMIGDIVLHNPQTGIQLANFNQKSSQGVKMIKFSPFNKNSLTSAGMDGTICVWDINSRTTQAIFNNSHSSRVNAVTYSSFNPVLLCSVGLDQKVIFYDIRDKKIVKTLQAENPLTALAFSNDGHTIVVGSLYGGVSVYDLKAGSNVKLQLKGHESCINYLDFIKITDDMKKTQSGIDEERDIKQSFSSLSTPQQNMNSTVEDTLSKKMQIESSASSVKSLRVTPPTFDELPQKNEMIGRSQDPSPLTPGSMDFLPNKKNSVLDPNDELKSKYNYIEEIRKNALEKMDTKPKTGLLSGDRSAGRPPTLAGSTIKENLGSEANRKFPTTSFNDISQKDNSIMTSTRKLNDTSELQGVAKNMSDNFNQKTDGYANAAQNVKEFSEGQQTFLKECFNDMKNHFSDTLQNMHLEMIRQFQIQQNELNNILEKNFTQYSQLQDRYETLKQENDRLKKTSF
jgi:protein NEDD1